jgi:hypothetical protein
MKRPAFSGHLEWEDEEFEFRGELCSITLGLDYSISEFTPATMYQPHSSDPGDPAEGGEIELQNIRVLHTAIGEIGRTATDEERRAMLKQIDNDDNLIDRLQQYVAEHAEASEPDPDRYRD